MASSSIVHLVRSTQPEPTRFLQVIGSPSASFAPLRLWVPDLGRQFEVCKRIVVIGRHSSADVQLLAADVSRLHCRLFRHRKDWMIEDLGSLNGTYINGQRVKRCPILPNNQIQVGERTIHVLAGEADDFFDLCPAWLDHRSRVLSSIATRLASGGSSAA